MQVTENFFEREGVRRPQRKNHAFFGGGCLELEIEALAELLAKRETPRAVHAAAERRVQDELHAARLVEEALDDELFRGRNDAEAALAFREVFGDLPGRG